MSKFDAALEKYTAQLQSLLPNEQIVTDSLRYITSQLGPTIYHRDASMVSTSDPKEMERVKTNYLMRKLGYSDTPELDNVIQSVCDMMKGERQKHRAVFYYLLQLKLGWIVSDDETVAHFDAIVYQGSLAETPSGDKDVPVYITLDRIAEVFTQHVDYDDSEAAEGQRIRDIRDKGKFSTVYDEKWGELITLESKLYGTVSYQLDIHVLRQLNEDRSAYTGFEAAQLTGGNALRYSGVVPGNIRTRVEFYANYVTQTYYKYTGPNYELETIYEEELPGEIIETGTFERAPHDAWGLILQLTPLEGEPGAFVVADDGHLQELSADLSETAALVLERMEIQEDSCSA